MSNIIWSLEVCPKCEDAKIKMKEKGIEFEERDCQDLINGKETNLKAVREFVKKKHTSPLILIDGVFKSVEDI